MQVSQCSTQLSLQVPRANSLRQRSLCKISPLHIALCKKMRKFPRESLPAQVINASFSEQALCGRFVSAQARTLSASFSAQVPCATLHAQFVVYEFLRTSFSRHRGASCSAGLLKALNPRDPSLIHTMHLLRLCRRETLKTGKRPADRGQSRGISLCKLL